MANSPSPKIAVGGSRKPVIEHRLFKPGLAVQPGRDPIAGAGHVARDRRIARLVRSGEADRGDAGKETDERQRGWKQQVQPGDLAGDLQRRARANRRAERSYSRPREFSIAGRAELRE